MKFGGIMKNVLIFGLLVLLLVNCEITTSSQKEEEKEAGPCVHIYEDPILVIESVSNSRSPDTLSQVRIYDITVDSARQDLTSLADDPSQNVSVQDSTILCTIPCGFGKKDGTYRFNARAEGYQDTTLAFEDVNYEIFNGGCPSSNSGSTEVSFEMKSK